MRDTINVSYYTLPPLNMSSMNRIKINDRLIVILVSIGTKSLKVENDKYTV